MSVRQQRQAQIPDAGEQAMQGYLVGDGVRDGGNRHVATSNG